MTRGCDHAEERKGGGKNNRSSKRRMKTSNIPNFMGSGAGRAGPWRGRGAVRHDWRDSHLYARSSNHHPRPLGRGGSPCSALSHPQRVQNSLSPCAREVPGLNSTAMPTRCWHHLPTCWFGKIPGVYHCKGDQGRL